jgi:PII-like signaling protein
VIPAEASLLSLYLNASRHRRGKSLYRAVVDEARAAHMAGASVFLVDLSFGAHRQVRDARSEYAFVDIPVVIEVVDADERVDSLLAGLGPMIEDGFTTVEPARVVRYAHHGEVVDTSAMDRLDASNQGEPHMSIEGDVQKVTIYIDSSDLWRGGNLAMAIVERCRKMGLAGATATLGVLGFGKHSVIHRSHLFGLSAGLPEKIEIIDKPDRIAEVLPILEEMVEGGLIVVQDLHAIHHAHHSTPPKG